MAQLDDLVMVTMTLEIALPDDLREDELPLLKSLSRNAIEKNVYLRAGKPARLVAPRVITTKVKRTTT